jgi:hypothetical protein
MIDLIGVIIIELTGMDWISWSKKSMLEPKISINSLVQTQLFSLCRLGLIHFLPLQQQYQICSPWNHFRQHGQPRLKNFPPGQLVTFCSTFSPYSTSRLPVPRWSISGLIGQIGPLL